MHIRQFLHLHRRRSIVYRDLRDIVDLLLQTRQSAMLIGAGLRNRKWLDIAAVSGVENSPEELTMMTSSSAR